MFIGLVDQNDNPICVTPYQHVANGAETTAAQNGNWDIFIRALFI